MGGGGEDEERQYEKEGRKLRKADKRRIRVRRPLMQAVSLLQRRLFIGFL
jgi:hypothetical protein